MRKKSAMRSGAEKGQIRGLYPPGPANGSRLLECDVLCGYINIKSVVSWGALDGMSSRSTTFAGMSSVLDRNRLCSQVMDCVFSLIFVLEGYCCIIRVAMFARSLPRPQDGSRRDLKRHSRLFHFCLPALAANFKLFVSEVRRQLPGSHG